MTVTTGARGTTSSGELSVVSTSTISCSNVRIWTSAPNSRASELAVSLSTVELMVIILPCSSSFLSTSFTRASSLSARSLTVMPSASVMFLVMGGGAVGAIEPRGCSGRAVCRRPPLGRGAGGRQPPGCPGRAPPGGGMPGRPGMPGRAPMPGCWRANRLAGQRTRAAKRLWRLIRRTGTTRRRWPRGQDSRPRWRHRRRAGPRRRSHDPRRAGASRRGLWPGRGCGGAGRVAGGRGVTGALGSSIRRRSDGGTMRPDGWWTTPVGSGIVGSVSRRLGRLGRDAFWVGRRRRDGRKFSDRQFDLDFGFRGVRHVGDGHLFDRRVVDFNFRVWFVNVESARTRPPRRLRRRRGWRRRRVRPGGWPWRP